MPIDLKLASFSDRELLHILNDHAGSDGWVESEHLISVLGLTRNGMPEDKYAKHVRQCIGVRLGWIRRLSQTVERHPKETGRWRLTVAGEEVVKAKLPQATINRLASLGDFTALPAIASLARQYTRTNSGAANLMRREWAHGVHPMRRSK